jgi:hypothetical protein
MGLDMSSLVKVWAIDVFGRPVIITPIVSQPGQGAYQRRGYLGYRDLEVVLDDGSTVVTQQVYLDILERDFAIIPRQRDRIDIPADGATPAEKPHEVVSSTRDGGGLTTLNIRELEPARP